MTISNDQLGSMFSSQGGAAKQSAMAPNLNSWIMSTQMLGLGLQAYGTYVESQAKAEALEYNAYVAERDASIVEKHTKHEIHKAKTTQRKLLARQIAATAASGRSFSGSPLEVMARSESEALMDQRIIRENGARERGRLHGQAIMDRGAAVSTKRSGRNRAFAGLLTSGASIYAKSNQFKKRGK